jgi:Peptidase family M23
LLVGSIPAVLAATATPPDFKLPLPCRTTWRATTYAVFNGIAHGNALDFNLVSGEDRGQPVLAAAAGRVERVTPTTGEVLLNHGGGWKTRYLHMADIQVTKDQYLSESQWIGRVDERGQAYGAHLHFEVLRDGVMVKPIIDGVQTNVTPTAPQTFTSTNCLAGEHGVWFANSLLRAPDGTIDFVTTSGERYWVPNQSVLSCLQASGARLRNVSAGEFNANPRNEYGDPGGRWADCTTWALGWMVKGSGPEVWFVAPNGYRYHVPSENVVMCLGGWQAVRPISDATLAQLPANPWGILATCQTPLFGELVKGSQPEVWFIGPKGTRYHVQSPAVVDCLNGWPQVVNIRDSRLSALPNNPYGVAANCNAALFDRLIRKANGQVDYVDGRHRRFWVPTSNIIACLGGWGSTIYLEDARFDAIPRNAANAWASCATKNS